MLYLYFNARKSGSLLGDLHSPDAGCVASWGPFWNKEETDCTIDLEQLPLRIKGSSKSSLVRKNELWYWQSRAYRSCVLNPYNSSQINPFEYQKTFFTLFKQLDTLASPYSWKP